MNDEEMDFDACNAPLLSICIPTYNRASLILKLAGDILSYQGNFELCVHVDGSSDNSVNDLQALRHPRLRLSSGANQGRAGALAAAVRMARGRFIMLSDDDDTLSTDGLAVVLADCAGDLPLGVAGFIYHLSDHAGRQIGGSFDVDRTNLLQLRADFSVSGDKREVILAKVLHHVLYDGAGRYARVPTSLFWSRLALKYDVICRNEVIGVKTYREGGMSDRIFSLKVANAYPMMLLYIAHLEGFLLRRYRNYGFAGRSAIALACYAALSVWSGLFGWLRRVA